MSNALAEPGFKDWLKNPFKIKIKNKSSAPASSISMTNIHASINSGNLQTLPSLRRTQSTGILERSMPRAQSSGVLNQASGGSMRRTPSGSMSRAIVPYDRQSRLSLTGVMNDGVKRASNTIFNKKFFGKAAIALAAVDGAKEIVNAGKLMYSVFSSNPNMSAELIATNASAEAISAASTMSVKSESVSTELISNTTPVTTERILTTTLANTVPLSNPTLASTTTSKKVPKTNTTKWRPYTARTTIRTTKRVSKTMATTKKTVTIDPHSTLGKWINRNVKLNEGRSSFTSTEPPFYEMKSSMDLYIPKIYGKDSQKHYAPIPPIELDVYVATTKNIRDYGPPKALGMTTTTTTTAATTKNIRDHETSKALVTTTTTTTTTAATTKNIRGHEIPNVLGTTTTTTTATTATTEAVTTEGSTTEASTTTTKRKKNLVGIPTTKKYGILNLLL